VRLPQEPASHPALRESSLFVRCVWEVALAVRVVPQFRAKLRLLVPVVSGLVQLVEDLVERLEITIQMSLAIPVPAICRRENTFRRKLIDQPEEFDWFCDGAEEVVILGVVVAESTNELAELGLLDVLVFEDTCGPSDAVVAAEASVPRSRAP